MTQTEERWLKIKSAAYVIGGVIGIGLILFLITIKSVAAVLLGLIVLGFVGICLWIIGVMLVGIYEDVLRYQKRKWELKHEQASVQSKDR